MAPASGVADVVRQTSMGLGRGQCDQGAVMSYSQRHYALVSPKSDTARDIADRQIQSEARSLARAETAVRFPVMATSDVAAEALRFQDARIAHHEARMGAWWRQGELRNGGQ